MDLNDKIIKVEKLVVFIDICSSTSIMEDLLRTENMDKWRSLIISLKKFLVSNKGELKYNIHKFLGDGWILLFPVECDKSELFNLLKKLCEEFESLYEKKINPVISTEISTVGITFGIDKGTLIKVIMNGRTEYLGRALNVAARLQAAIKDGCDAPQGKVLMSKNVYAILNDTIKSENEMKERKKNLRNIAGGTSFICMELSLLNYKYYENNKNVRESIRKSGDRQKYFIPSKN